MWMVNVMAHGTFRNKVSALIKKGIVRLVYCSKLGYYSLKGLEKRLKLTSNDMVVSSSVTSVTEDIAADKLLSYVSTLDNTADAIHDLHLKLSVIAIYSHVSSHPKYGKSINSRSKDIQLAK